MPAFNYVAITPAGKKKKGVLQADSERQLRQMLRDQGLVPFELKEAAEPSKKASGSGLFQKKVKAKDRALLVRQLATLIDAGLPHADALAGVIEQTNNSKVRSMMASIRSKVLEGHSLAAAMADYPKVFNEFYRFSIKASEESGNLAMVLNELADYSENMEEQSQKVKMALVYPILLTVVSVCIVAYLLGSVMPDIVATFQKQNAELPGLTVTLLAVSHFIRAQGLFMALGFVGLSALYSIMMRNESCRLKRDQLLLKLPIVKTVNITRYISTLAMLQKSGVPIDKSMAIAAQVVGNLEASNRLGEARTNVKGGAALMASLKATGLVPAMMAQLIDSGERSGELGGMLERAAKQQQKETGNRVKAAVSLFEPIMLLVMGGVVMLIVMSIIMPIMGMNQLVG